MRVKSWIRRNSYKIFLLLGALLPITIVAQQKVQLEPYKAKWPDEDAVYLTLNKSIDISLKEQDIDIRTSYHERMLFMTDNAGIYADRRLGYSSFRELGEIDARTLVPDKNSVKTLRVSEITESDPMSGGVFVDDYKEKSFVFPGAGPGAVAELRYSEIVKEPRFLGAFYFNSYIPVEEAELEITADKGVSLKYILLGGANDLVEFESNTKKGRTTYTWRSKQLDAMTYEEGAPAINNYEPHIVVYIDEVERADGSKVEILSDVSSLYGWYRELTKDVNTVPDDNLRTIVTELIEGAETDEEKTRRIFNWVQDNIRYIAFEEGLGGFVPREASKVCTKKYGDCKDMASITTEMLEYAGIEANLTWIGTRDIPYKYEEVPTPIVDNHMIASVVLNGERVFLDATDDQVAFGYPTSFIQGKQALVGKGDDFELVKVPEVTRRENGVAHLLDLEIKDGVLQGQANTVLTGYLRFNTLRRFAEVREERQDIFFKNSFNLGNNKAALSEIQLEGADERLASAKVNYQISVPDYAKSFDNEIYVNMNLDKRLQHQQIDMETRTLDREFEFRYTAASDVFLAIPDGYKLDYLPEDASFDDATFGFNIAYKEVDGKVRLTSELYVDCLLLEKDQFERWNEMIDALDAAYQEVVVFVAEQE